MKTQRSQQLHCTVFNLLLNFLKTTILSTWSTQQIQLKFCEKISHHYDKSNLFQQLSHNSKRECKLIVDLEELKATQVSKRVCLDIQTPGTGELRTDPSGRQVSQDSVGLGTQSSCADFPCFPERELWSWSCVFRMEDWEWSVVCPGLWCPSEAGRENHPGVGQGEPPWGWRGLSVFSSRKPWENIGDIKCLLSKSLHPTVSQLPSPRYNQTAHLTCSFWK